MGAYRKGGICYDALKRGAILCGHIDTAMVYDGAEVKDSAGKPCTLTELIKEVCAASPSLVKITTKVNSGAWSALENPMENNVILTHVERLTGKNMVVDEILMHSPVLGITAANECDREKCYARDLECYRRLREMFPTKRIGLSNFDVQRLQYLLDAGEKPDSVHMEWSPWIQPRGLKKLCDDNGIQTVAFRPFNNGDKSLSSLNDGRFDGMNMHAVILRWITMKGMNVVMSSNNPAHVEDNLMSYKHTVVSQKDCEYLDNTTSDWTGSCMVKFCQDHKPVW